MPHDTTKSDLWYHDAIMPTCILGNWIHILLDHKDLSEVEKREILKKALVEVENNRKIIYEEYLEKRRLENGGCNGP
jgi:hypothetical protein